MCIPREKKEKKVVIESNLRFSVNDIKDPDHNNAAVIPRSCE